MTAVATPNYQPLSRPGWGPSNGGQGNLSSMGADEVSRMFLPRKSAQRSNSTSSIASSASSTSASAAPAVQANGAQYAGTTDLNGFGPRKKPARGLWHASKAEPVLGISTRPSEPLSTNATGPSIASAPSTLQNPSQSPQPMAQQQSQHNNGSRAQGQAESPAILQLLPINGTFERKTITIPFYPEVLRIGRQTNQKTVPTPTNGYFDSKVLSRQHAEVWADRSGKIWIRDVKSSNGTFVNAQRLSAENRDSEPHELKERDVLELGIDIVSEDQKTIVHHKVAAKVEHAGIYVNGSNTPDLNFGDLDQNGNSGIMLPPHPQNGGPLRSRNGNQSAVGNRSMGPATGSLGVNNMVAATGQRHANFWLTPVTMEQIVKRLNSELKQAKQQSQELHRTSQYMDSILSGQGPDGGRAQHIQPPRPIPLRVDARARFLDPPAPPPTHPLPEKPDYARGLPEDSAATPILRRTNTAKPMLNGATPTKIDSSHQITSLVEALSMARKEIDTQGVRLKDLETMLAQERLARESAEERAMRLEMESRNNSRDDIDDVSETSSSDTTLVGAGDNTYEKDAPHSSDNQSLNNKDVDASATRLQQRLDLMLAQMDEMRHQMNKYKQRAESAEAESAKSRTSLAEMVERIRREDAERAGKFAQAHTNFEPHPQKGHHDPSENGHEDVSPGALVQQAGIQMNGKPVGAAEFAELEHVVLAELGKSRGKQRAEGGPGIVVQSTPFVTMIGVVLLGYGLMTYLNGLQRPTGR